MAQDLKITAVVKRDPWSNDYGKYQTYAVQFDKTGDTWVQWNKKFKGDEEPTPPQTGDEVFGDIANGKFKIGKKDGGFTPSASNNSFKGEAKKEWVPRDDDAIKAQFAIKAAVQVLSSPIYKEASGATVSEQIEMIAKDLYQMVDRVKGGDSPKAQAPMTSTTSERGLPSKTGESETTTNSGYEAFKAAGGQVKSDLPPTDAYEDMLNGEPIDISKIPF